MSAATTPPITVPFLLLLTAFGGPLLAQTATVATGSAPDTARLPSGWTRSLTAQPDGALWCLVREANPTASALRLYRSLDQGATWAFAADTPTLRDGQGAVVADRSCNVLHVAWNAADTGSFQNLYHQRYDTAANAWLGAPDVLLTGANADDQYYADDIAVTARGTVGIVFNTHRTPLLAGFTGWSGGIYVRRAGDPSFQGPYRLNTDSYGMLASTTAVGETFHTSFRTNTGLYGIRYRAFDATALQFLTNADVPLYGANQGAMRSTNSSCMTSDAAGNLYVLYSVGSPNPAGGALEVAFASAGTVYATWTHTLVESDAALTAGNTTFQHYTLARAESGAIYAVFAKAGESYQNLHARILTPDPATGGALVIPDPATAGPIPLVSTSEANTFLQVDGLRQEAVHGGAVVATSGNPASRPDGYVGFLRTGAVARTLEWGTSCSGALPAAPRLVSTTLPQSGSTFGYGIESGPASAVGVSFAGFDCLVPPFDLGVLGMPGCAVFTTPLATRLVITDPAGAAPLSLAIPPGVGGFALQFGALLLSPAANPGGAVATNALAAAVY